MSSVHPLLAASRARQVDAIEAVDHDHTLCLYASETALEDHLADLIQLDLRAGHPVVLMATGRQLDHPATTGLTLVDAHRTLGFVMGDDELPDPERFHDHLGRVLATCSGHRVRVYDQLSHLLLRRGLQRAAARLEELWNELLKHHSASLVCAYAVGDSDLPRYADTLETICASHTRVVPSGKREVSTDVTTFGLLQHARALEREVARYRERARLAVAARDEAEQGKRLKDDFMALLSHELRSPLSAICGWAAVLRSDRRSNPEILQKAARIIDRNARAQTRLIGDLVDISRVISGTVVLERRPVSLVAVIEEALESLEDAATKRDIAVSHDDIVGDSYLVMGDRARLRQVVGHLLSNAIKFTPDDGHIEVRLRRSHGMIVVEVEDSGEGIDPSLLPCLFDRFQVGDARERPTRPPPARVDLAHGGGERLALGLAIVRQLVKLHDGIVVASSKGRGAGATFSVTLPELPATEDASDAAEPMSPAQNNLSGVRIVLVDDEAELVEPLDHALTACGAEVYTAASAREGLALLRSTRPHLLVSDIGMPAEDGYSFIRRVRQLPAPECDLPAVALTSYAGVDDVKNAVAAGFQCHVAKPADPTTLLQTIALLLQQPSTEA